MRNDSEYLKIQIRKKIDSEFKAFRKRVLKDSKRRIFERATEISFRDHIAVIFYDLIDEMDFTELAVLMKIDTPLEKFYKAWCECEEDSTEIDMIACFWRTFEHAEKEMI